MHRTIVLFPFVAILACAGTTQSHTTASPSPEHKAEALKPVTISRSVSPADSIREVTEKAEGELRAGSFARAEDVAAEGLQLITEHPKLQTSQFQARLLHVIGVSRGTRNDYAGAEDALSRASTLRAKAPGMTQADMAFGLLLLGRAQLLECKLDDARASLERTTSIDEPLLPATEVDFALANGLLGEVQEESGHPDVASRHFQRATAVLGTSEAREPWALVGFLYRLAALERNAGTVELAAHTLEQAIGISTRFPGRPSEPGLDAVSMYQELARSGAGKFLAAQKINRWRGGPADGPTLASAGAPQKDTYRWDAARCSVDHASAPSSTDAGGQVSNADQVVAGLRQSFRACYNAELQTGSDAGGSIRYVAKVGPSGAVVDVRATALGLSPDMEQCAGQHVLAARFSPPRGGHANVVIPVTFENERSFRLPRLPF